MLFPLLSFWLLLLWLAGPLEEFDPVGLDLGADLDYPLLVLLLFCLFSRLLLCLGYLCLGSSPSGRRGMTASDLLTELFTLISECDERTVYFPNLLTST